MLKEKAISTSFLVCVVKCQAL